MRKNLRDKKITAVICIRNLSIPQSIALEDMMATWCRLGVVGASRWTSFFADGDGNFRPEISYNGRKPENTELLSEEDTWKGSEYRIDFDSIGWKIHDNEDIRIQEIKRSGIYRIIFETIKFGILSFIKDVKLNIKLYKIRKRSKKCSKLPMSEAPCEQSEPPEKSCDIS